MVFFWDSARAARWSLPVSFRVELKVIWKYMERITSGSKKAARPKISAYF